jgi:hypothetical protein
MKSTGKSDFEIDFDEEILLMNSNNGENNCDYSIIFSDSRLDNDTLFLTTSDSERKKEDDSKKDLDTFLKLIRECDLIDGFCKLYKNDMRRRCLDSILESDLIVGLNELCEKDVTLESLKLIIPEMKKDFLKKDFRDRTLRRLLSKVFNEGYKNGLNLLSKCDSNKLSNLEHSFATIIYHLYNE